VTTGLWAVPDEKQRLSAVKAWTELPDFASVNWHEPGADELADVLLTRGVGVEAGLFHAGRRGVQARIGLEDTLHLPDGATAPGNAELVAAARRLLSR
jgi:uncharacterized protein (DUF849 family)